MLQLHRIVRFTINPGPPPVPDARPGVNGFAAAPPMTGLGRHYELEVTCRGEPEAATGYLIDIKDIDRAVRSQAVPVIDRACREQPAIEPAVLLPEVFGAIGRSLGPRLETVVWRLTPYYAVEMSSASPTTALLRQRFDFAASHRLHAPSLSDEENRRRFGKCNNPSGHGHNYRLEPCVQIPAGPDAGADFSLALLERLTEDVIIQRFDHKHLNVDTREFSVAAGGLIPTVENIAKVCFELLAPAIRQASPHAVLRCVTVWETDRTSCTYPVAGPTPG